ncbi:MAG: hypothetical protein ACRDPC_08685 [Solirubrobacteraceae bacterium]
MLLATVLIGMLVAAPRAGAEWSPPFDLSPEIGSADYPQIAVDPSGGAIAVWNASGGASDGIQARRIDASGTLGPVQDVTEAGELGSSPQVAVDAAGTAMVVWIGVPDGRLRSRRLTPGGALEDSDDVSPAGQSAGEPGVAVDPSGNATVVWSAPMARGTSSTRAGSTQQVGPGRWWPHRVRTRSPSGSR